MKIRQIPAARSGSIQNGRTLKISPTMQLLFGFVDADTTAMRNGIRQFFFGYDKLKSGINTDRTEFEVASNSGSSIGTRFNDGIRMRNLEIMPEWNRVLHEIDLSTYQSFFELNFGNPESSGAQLCFQLNRRFNAPFGDVSSNHDEGLGEERVEELKQEISSINLGISDTRAKREQFHSRLEDLESSQFRPHEFDTKQRQTLRVRVENLEEKLTSLKEAACRLEEEIEITASSAFPVRSRTPQPSTIRSNAELSNQIASVDSQIERWKTIKLDVESRLTQLKGDLGCSRVDEFDEMLDEVRMVNQISESKLLGLMDASSDERDLSEYRELVELNHQLCDGLATIQNHWREIIAKGEIDSLTKCSAELDGFLNHLSQKRMHLEGRHLGSEGNSRCRCKTHAPGEKIDVRQIEQMKLRHAELLHEISIVEKNLIASRQELNALDSIPDLQSEIAFARDQIRACNEKHSKLQDKKDRLLNRLRLAMEEEKRNSRLINLISGYFAELTDGHYRRVFLDDQGHDFIVVDSNGEKTRFQDTDFVSRNRARMAVSLGCARLLAESGYNLPLVWEDPFIGFESADIETVTGVLQEYSRTTGQVILLTNNRFVKQLFESMSIPCLDLPDRYSGDSFPGVPELPGRNAEPSGSDLSNQGVEYRSRTDWSYVNRDFDVAAMDQYGSGSSQFQTEVDQVRSGEFRHYTEGSYSKSNNGRDVRESSSNRTRSASSRGRSNSRSEKGYASNLTDLERQRTQSTRRHRDSGERSSEQLENYKFYLEMSSRVEAAPTIGPKTAEKLEKIGICTVSDLVSADAQVIAEQLGQKRIKFEDVSDWQRQALLVCEVPNLRGHDAQLLVACGINDAVQLAGMDAEPLYEIIGPFAQSKDGKKLLRGSTQPDLEEVTNWVRWARYQNENRQAA